MKKLKINNWTNCIQDRNNWKYMLRRAKHSKIEVVAPKEEEEEEEEEGGGGGGRGRGKGGGGEEEGE
jgi:hypothetical protein